MRLRFAFLLLAAAAAHAEVRRALLVGIDHYMQPSRAYKSSAMTRERLKAVRGSPSRTTLESLDGAVNDAQAMKEILIEKFGFKAENIILLPNPKQPATADNILGLLQSFLIDQARPGDTSVFYYAGHGSRIRNFGTKNADGFDSTIVPADALAGVPDIRSKELARIYDQAPRKHVALTVILDSCFSGGASRGAMARDKLRAQPPDLKISVNETLDGPLPEDAGVLVISASQEYEPAAELASTDLDGPHGAFTWALLHVLGASPADDRVDRIFQRARALMQSRAPGQEPVLLAKNGLNTRGLFGQPASADSQAAIAVGRVNGKIVKLNGGLAMNLHEGCELKAIQAKDVPARLRITKVTGLSTSDAILIEGAELKPGDLFLLDKWVAPDRDMLRVFIGPPAPRAQIESAVAAANELRRRGMLDEDPTAHAPTHVIEWDGSHWQLRPNRAGAQGVTVDLGRLHLPTNAQVNLMIPAPANFPGSPIGGSVAVANSVESADYILLGRAAAQSVEYAWALPDATEGDVLAHRSPRPLRSDWIAWKDGAAAPLREAVLTLARVAGWMELSASAPASSWPYYLALERTDSGALLDRPEVHGGEQYRLVLRADPELLRKSAFVTPRRVYVFVVDSWGQSQLLVGETNIGNEYPHFNPASPAPPEKIVLDGSALDIDKPYGLDHYFLLTTATPIDSPETVLTFDGARTRGANHAPSDPLARLLRNTATATRGEVSQVPVNWSIEATTILSLPK